MNQQVQPDMELIGTLVYQLKTESTTLCQAILESSNNDVRAQLTGMLTKSLQNQKTVFDLMNQKGWYKVEPAPKEQYSRTNQSFLTMQQQQAQQGQQAQNAQ